MVGAATVSIPEMTRLIGRLPSYEAYTSSEEAAEGERTYRLALGRMLKECGDQMLNAVERRPHLITSEQHDTVDALIDVIGLILRQLNRQGVICLRGAGEDTIAELEELDLRLLLLLEEALALSAGLAREGESASWFKGEAGRLSRRLCDFSRTAEARNYLLGLGWESEFRLNPFGG